MNNSIKHEARVRYTVLASEHSGDDLVLWLRYLSKWVNPSGHIFSDKDIEQIRREKKITPLQKIMLSEAITPGTPTNKHVVKMRQPIDVSDIQEMMERLAQNERTD